MNSNRFAARALWQRGAALLISLLMAGAAIAAVTDVANAPLFTSSNSAVKPNIMFVLDDSGSMAWNYLPDDANFSSTKYGRVTSQCNGVAYNPAITYRLPVSSTGVAVAAGSIATITDPAAQTSNPRTLSSLASMPASATGTMSVTVTASSPRTSWFPVGSTVTVYNSGDSTRYIVGTVASWDTATGALRIDLTGGTIVGTGAMADPRAANGAPATYYSYSGSQKALGYTYTSSGVITSTTFYQECNSAIGSAPGNAVFTRVTVTSSAAEAQNYANWYQYYRTRMDMMQSSISLAFSSLDSRYRIGFSTISQTGAVAGTDFLDIADFTATQKSDFYTAMNAATPGNSTPLRGALSKAGQYFAKKARGQTVDPIQYSCQRNFTILSTDGYWNTGDESTTSPKYGPYQLDNTTNVDEQDAYPTLRPMFDGATVQSTTTETWTATAVTTATTTTTQTTVVTSATGATSYVPTTGYEHYTYTLYTKQTVSSITRPSSTAPSPYYVTIRTSAPHNLSSGQTVVVSYSGTAPTGYTGTVVVTVIDANTFKYPSTSGARPGSLSGISASNFTIALDGAQSCSSGRGVVMQQRQTQDLLTSTTTTTTNSTSTFSTLTSVRTQTDRIPYSRVTITLNGSLVSDTGPIQGTLQSTSSTSTSTVAQPSTTAVDVATTSGTSYTAWVDNGTPSQWGANCVSLPNPNPSAAVAIAPTTTAYATTSGPTPGGPTTTSGTPTTVTSAPVNSESAHTTRTSSTASNGTSDTLADIAAYYYNTDLRTSALSNCTGSLGSSVCDNNVPGTTADAAHSYGDSASWQHMTTFTLGLGVSGLLTYDPNYLTQRSGDFFDITTGQKNWPVPGGSKSAENIDDLWHAAVNGRGQYFSAGDPQSLSASLTSALASIKATTGAAAAASTSSLQPVQGDNDIYVAQFTSVKWIGDLLSYKIDPTSGAISTTITWSAKTQLDAMAPSSRTIYYSDPAGGATLRPFTYASLVADSYGSYFDGFCSKTGVSGAAAPAQCAGLSTTDTTSANAGANLVAFLRGDQTKTYYRSRDSAMGDVINASPVFVGKPSFRYIENAYTTFASTNASRTAVVLVAANDGMLHAFDRITGNERWAFMPSFVLPNLYKLADTDYGNNHRYYIDGSPQMGDIYVGGQWKTIVVGGLGAGGRGYYALDVTNPVAPKLLWEFSNTNLGLTFGNPVITKRDDGTWVVVFASGYNNVSPGDGNGHLFVLNADTGAILKDISTFTSGTTPAGTAATPSGMVKVNVWIDSDTNNLARRFYAGDLLGNLWRIDIDSLVQPFQSALLLAQLKDASGTPQSIMVKPSLGQVTYNGVNYPVVYVATGRYLGLSDLANTTVQSVYAIKDPLTATPYGNVRASTNFVAQTISAGTDANGNPTRSIASNPVNWATNSGWRADFPGTGERVSVNTQLILNTLYVGTNVPSNDACTVGGSSFLYKFDIVTGSKVSGETDVGTYVGNVLIEGLTTVQLGTASSSAPGSIVTILTRSDATLQTDVGAPPTMGNALRRTSWRELAD